jgi:hypothetical protein
MCRYGRRLVVSSNILMATIVFLKRFITSYQRRTGNAHSHTHTHTHSLTHTHSHTLTHSLTHTHSLTCINALAYTTDTLFASCVLTTHLFIYIFIYTHTTPHTHTHTHTNTNVHTQTHTHVRTHTHTHTHARTYTHIHIHTHTHVYSVSHGIWARFLFLPETINVPNSYMHDRPTPLVFISALLKVGLCMGQCVVVDYV